MAVSDGNPGMSKLANAIDARMRRYHGDITGDLKIDFGVIGDDGSLVANSFPKPIPKGSYTVCRTLAGLATAVEVDGEYKAVVLPALAKGDHVLLVWVQSEPCVVDVITRYQV